MPFRNPRLFSRSQRDAIRIAIAIGILAFLGTYLFRDDETETAEEFAADSIAYAKEQALENEKTYYYDAEPHKKVERFAFDPNTADSTTLLRLGLAPWQVRNIYKYRAKGGIYRQPDDFARVYGLTQKQFRELRPYIRISDDYLPAAMLVKNSPKQTYYSPKQTYATAQPTQSYEQRPAKISAGETIDANHADTSMLQRIPGIGSYRAKKIVDYRTRLGGFTNEEQLLEISDFPPESLPYIAVSGTPDRINLNKLKLKELMRHPYINFHQAKAIMDYRRLRGKLQSLDDLKLLDCFTEQDLKRLEPYVTF